MHQSYINVQLNLEVNLISYPCHNSKVETLINFVTKAHCCYRQSSDLVMSNLDIVPVASVKKKRKLAVFANVVGGNGIDAKTDNPLVVISRQ